MNCASCGSNALVEGSLIETSCAGTSMFQPKGVSMWKRVFGVGTRGVRAYGCIHCHHLQLAVNFTDEDLQRYQEFEGESADAMEPVNSEPLANHE
jgi:hypothetical protein